MEIREHVPMVIFDNRCYLCIKFARCVDFFARGRITMVGHYTDFGERIRDAILDESALEMFWFIDGKRAYGGRAALLPMIRSILSGRTRSAASTSMSESCGQQCKTARAVFVRSASLLTSSRKIDL